MGQAESRVQAERMRACSNLWPTVMIKRERTPRFVLDMTSGACADIRKYAIWTNLAMRAAAMILRQSPCLDRRKFSDIFVDRVTQDIPGARAFDIPAPNERNKILLEFAGCTRVSSSGCR